MEKVASALYKKMDLVAYLKNFVGKDVNDAGNANSGFRSGEIPPLEMSMPVEQVTRLRHAHQPVDGFQSLVSLGFLVVNSKRRRMRDENIKRASILEAVQQQARQHAKRPQIRIALRILIRPIRAVADRAAKAADQNCFVAHHFQVQVRAAFHMGKRIVRHINWIVVAWHVHQGLVQDCEYILKIWVGKVSASYDQFNVVEMPVLAQTVEPFDNFITHRQDFHRAYCALEHLSLQGRKANQGLFRQIQSTMYETEMFMCFN